MAVFRNVIFRFFVQLWLTMKSPNDKTNKDIDCKHLFGINRIDEQHHFNSIQEKKRGTATSFLHDTDSKHTHKPGRKSKADTTTMPAVT